MPTASSASEIAPPPHPRDELKSLALEADQFFASDDWKNADAPTRQKYLDRTAEVFDEAFTSAESSLDAAEADSFYNSTTAFLQGKMAEHNSRDADEKRRRVAADKSMQVFTERQKVTPEQVSGVVNRSLEVAGGMSAQTRGSGVMKLDGEQGKASIGVQPLDWTPSAEEFWKDRYDLTASEAEKKSAKDFARSKGKDSLADDLLYRSAVAGEESAKLAARDIAFSKGADAAGVAAAEQEATSAYRRNAKLAALESTQSSERNPKGRKLPFRVVRTNGMLNIEPEEGKAEEAMMAAERMGLLTSEEAARLIPSGVEMDKEFASRPKAQGGLVTAVKEFGSAILPALGTAAGTAIGAAASKGDVSTAMVGGASGGSAALWLQNKVFGQVDQAQREANARAHPGWAQVGSFVPFLVSMFQKTPPALTTVGKMAQTAKVSLTPGTAAARWESALQSGVAMGRAGFSSGVQQRYVEGNKDVNPIDEGVRSFIAGGAMGILKPAKSILMAMTGKAVKDAAAVTFAEGLYDLAVHNKPIDFKAIADEAPGTFTAFALQNAVMGVFHKFQHSREMAKRAGKSAAAANTAAAEAAEAQAKRFRKDGFIESAIASEALAETHRRAAKQDEKAATEQYWKDVAKADEAAPQKLPKPPESSVPAPHPVIVMIDSAVAAHANELAALGHPSQLTLVTVPEGDTGLRYNPNTGRIEYDPVALERQAARMAPRQRAEWIKRAVSEEVFHAATDKYASESPENRAKLYDILKDKDAVAAAEEAYGKEAFDGLDTNQKAFEVARVLLQGPRALTEAAYRFFKGLLRWLDQKLKNLSPDTKELLDGIKTKLEAHESGKVEDAKTERVSDDEMSRRRTPLSQKDRRSLQNRAEEVVARLTGPERAHAERRLEEISRNHQQIRREHADAKTVGEKLQLEMEMVETENDWRKITGEAEIDIYHAVTAEDIKKDAERLYRREQEIKAKLKNGEAITPQDRQDWKNAGMNPEELPKETKPGESPAKPALKSVEHTQANEGPLTERAAYGRTGDVYDAFGNVQRKPPADDGGPGVTFQGQPLARAQSDAGLVSAEGAQDAKTPLYDVFGKVQRKAGEPKNEKAQSVPSVQKADEPVRLPQKEVAPAAPSPEPVTPVAAKPVEQPTPAPKDTTERIQEAAYRDASGKIYKTGAFHDSSKLPKKFQADNENARGVEPGWLTSSGRFVGREEGFAIAAASKQVKDSYKAEWPNVLGHFNVKPETLGKQPTTAQIEQAIADANWLGTVREVPAPRSMGGEGVKLYIPVDASGKDVSVGGQTILGKTPAEAIELAQKNTKPAPAPPAAAPSPATPQSEGGIFGYSWADIRSKQQGGTLAALIRGNAPKATESDFAVLEKHGMDWLYDNKKVGIIDRLGLPVERPSKKAVEAKATEGQFSIYQMERKDGMKWMVQSGEKRGFGDGIFDTKAEAEKYAATEKTRQQERAAAVEREAQKNRDEEAAKELRERDVNDFTAAIGATPLAAGKLKKTLMEQVAKRTAGKVYEGTRAQVAKQLLAAGFKPTSEQVDAVKDLTGAQMNRMDNKEQAAHEKRKREAGKKTEYRLENSEGNLFEVTKAEHDYAKWLEAAQVNAAPAPVTEAAALRAKIVKGATVEVSLVRGSKLTHRAKVQDVDTQNGVVTVTFKKGKKFNGGETQTVRLDQVAPLASVQTRMLNEVQFEGMTEDQKRQTKADAKEFDRLVRDHPEMGWYNWRVDDLAGTKSGDMDIAAERKRASMEAMEALGGDPTWNPKGNSVIKAELLPKLKAAIEEKAHELAREAPDSALSDDTDLLPQGESPEPAPTALVAAKPETPTINVLKYNDSTKITGTADGGLYATVRTIKRKSGQMAYEVKGYGKAEGQHPDLEQTYEARGEQEAIDAAKGIARREIAKQTPEPAAPKLRPSDGKGTGELLQGEAAPFNLVAETAADIAKREARESAEQVAKEAKDAAEAKAKQDKEQGNLFDEDPFTIADSAPTTSLPVASVQRAVRVVAERLAGAMPHEVIADGSQYPQRVKDAMHELMAFQKWKDSSFSERAALLKAAGQKDFHKGKSSRKLSGNKRSKLISEWKKGTQSEKAVIQRELGLSYNQSRLGFYDLPDHAQRALIRKHPRPAVSDLNRIRGVVVSGEIYINAASIEHARQAIETFMHEAAGHGGVDALLKAFGGKATTQLDAMLKRLFPDDYAAVQRSYEPSKQVSETLARIMQRVGPEMSAQTRTRWQRVMDWLRNALNNLGVKRWSTNDVMALLRRGVDAVRKQRARATDVNTLVGSELTYAAREAGVVLTPEETMYVINRDPAVTADVRARVSEARGDGPKMSADNEQSRPFYSALTKTVQALPQETMTVQQARAAIEKGAKKDEIAMSGIFTDPLSPLAGKQPGDKVTKAELTGYALERQATVQDVVLGGVTQPISERDFRWASGVMEDVRRGISVSPSDIERATALQRQDEQAATANAGGETHFSQYQLPGADEGSYREMFVTWPEKTAVTHPVLELPEGYSFKPDAELGWNIIGKNGEVVAYSSTSKEAALKNFSKLFEGVQIFGERRIGKWKDGHGAYDDIANPIVRIRRNLRTDAEGKRTYFIEEMQGPGKGEQEKMPPELRKRIYEIGMKRALRDAVDEGADAIAWTTGEQQAERYDLSKQVEKLSAKKNADGSFDIRILPTDGTVPRDIEVESESKLVDTVGKELAEKISKQEVGMRPEYSGDNLKVGGEGLKRVYDQMLPAIANDLAKKFGVKARRASFGGEHDASQNTEHDWTGAQPERIFDRGGEIYLVNNRGQEELVSNREELRAYLEENGRPRGYILGDKAGEYTVHSLPIPEALKTQQRGGNVLFSLKDSRVTPEQDRAYADAVKRGDMETAQRMVDEAAKAAGYVPALHGTPDENPIRKAWTFATLRDRMRGTQAEDSAYFFTDDPATAKTYADPRRAMDYQAADPAVLRVFIKLENPMQIDGKGQKWKRQTQQSVEQAKANGHDGYIVTNTSDEYHPSGKRKSTVFAAFNPSQIKIADPITRDASGAVIPLSARFNPDTSDIRFSLKDENPKATSTTKRAVMDKEREVAMLQGSADKLLQDIRKSGRPPTVEEMQQIAAIDSLIAKRQAEIQAEVSNVAQGATPPEINIADLNAEPPDREETGESGPRTYGGKFDSMDAQRAERGLPPLARRFRKANRVLWDAAVKRFETEPKWADRLVDEISSGEKTVLTDEEFAGVFAQQIDLHNKRQEAADRARDPNLSEEEQRDALDQFQYYEKKLQASEILKGMAGSEAGAALQSLKLMANEDFSLAAMEARERKAKQSGLTPEEVDRIRDEATRIAKAQADLDARKAATEAAERIANAEAKIAEWSKIPSRVLEYAKQKVNEWVSAGNAASERLRARAGQVNVGVDPMILGDIFLFARGKIAQGMESFGNFAASTASEFGEWVRPYLKPAWDKAMKYLNTNQPGRKVSDKQKARQQAATEDAASIEDGIRAMAEEGLPDDMGRYVKRLANAYVKSGATTVKGVMARLHAFLDPVMGNPTDDVLLDLWTDYGGGKAATEDALKRLQSQIRQEALIVRQIIDAEAALVRSQAGEDVGDYLKLTGQQRVPVRDQARALAQQLNELKKKIPPPQSTAESRRQSALDALEKRTRNRIKDLRFEIAKGERTIKNRGVTPTSPNLEALRAELATVEAEHLAVFGRREATPEQKLKSAIKSAERAEQKALAELEAAKRGVFTRPVQKGAETRNEVLVIRARADAARAETQALKELANPPLSDAQKRLDAALVARERWEQMLAGEQKPTSRQPQESLTQLEEDARMEIAAMRELAAQIRRDAKPATDPDDAKVRALEAAAAEYERRVNESDFTAKSKTTNADSARVAQARALRDAALAAYNAAKNAAGVTEQTKIANRKAAMLRQIADLTDRLAKSDFEKRPPRPPVDLSKDSEAVRIASDLQEIKSNYAKRLLHYIKERRGGYEKFTDAMWTAITAERSLMGSGDLSATRQGIRMAYSHPIMAAKAMWRSIRTIFSQKQAVSYEAERKLRPNYALYKPMKIQMPSVEAEAHDRMSEEGVRSNIEDWADIKLSGNPLLVLPKLVPKLLGHYVRASSRTFTTFLNELAADVADYRINELRDKPMSKIEKEALGDMINSARGRGLKAGAGKLAQFVFYSANFLAARAKNLSGYHVWRRNSSARIRKIALKEQFRAIAGWMVVSAISRYFYGDTGDDEDMLDKAKRLFKLRVTDSDARMEYDYTGGEAKLVRLGAALIEGISTTIQAMLSGQEEADKQRAFTSYATIGREIRSISAPWMGVAADLYTGSNYDGKVPTVPSIARDLTVPLAWRSADEFFERAGFAKTVGAKLQEAIGVGVSVTRDKTAPKERRYSR